MKLKHKIHGLKCFRYFCLNIHWFIQKLEINGHTKCFYNHNHHLNRLQFFFFFLDLIFYKQFYTMEKYVWCVRFFFLVSFKYILETNKLESKLFSYHLSIANWTRLKHHSLQLLVLHHHLALKLLVQSLVYFPIPYMLPYNKSTSHSHQLNLLNNQLMVVLRSHQDSETFELNHNSNLYALFQINLQTKRIFRENYSNYLLQCKKMFFFKCVDILLNISYRRNAYLPAALELINTKHLDTIHMRPKRNQPNMNDFPRELITPPNQHPKYWEKKSQFDKFFWFLVNFFVWKMIFEMFHVNTIK